MGTITKLVHGCSRYCSRSLGEIAEATPELRRARERWRRLLTERPRQARELFEVGSRRRIGAGHQSDGEAGDDRVDPRRAHGHPDRGAEHDRGRRAPRHRRVAQRDQRGEQAGGGDERHQRDMLGIDGRDHDERDEVVDDGHRQQPHA
jgi:hypothetical protein